MATPFYSISPAAASSAADVSRHTICHQHHLKSHKYKEPKRLNLEQQRRHSSHLDARANNLCGNDLDPTKVAPKEGNVPTAPWTTGEEDKADVSDDATVVDDEQEGAAVAKQARTSSSSVAAPADDSTMTRATYGAVGVVKDASLESIQEIGEEQRQVMTSQSEQISPSQRAKDSHHHHFNLLHHRHHGRPSSSSGTSTFSSRSRVIFAPTVRIGSRPAPRAVNVPTKHQQQHSDTTIAVAAAASVAPAIIPLAPLDSAAAHAFSVHQPSSRGGSGSRSSKKRRPQTAPQDRDGKFDEVKASTAGRLVTPTSWKPFGARRFLPPATASTSPLLTSFPDGFVSAPLHLDGPFGGDADVEHDVPGISPALPEDLPPPPRLFVPGTLILVRDESLWSKTDPSECAGGDAIDTSRDVDTGARHERRDAALPALPTSHHVVDGQNRRHSLPIEAALPSEHSLRSPLSNEEQDQPSPSLQLLNTRLDEVVSRRRLSFDEADEDEHVSQPVSHSVPSSGSALRPPASHSRNRSEPNEPHVLWHGDTPADPPRAQKRRIPLRAVVVATRAMKRFFHARKPPSTEEGQDGHSSHRRGQSMIDEVLHGRRHEEDEEDQYLRGRQMQQDRADERRDDPPGSVHLEVEGGTDIGSRRRLSAPYAFPASKSKIKSDRQGSEQVHDAAGVQKTTPARIVVSNRTGPTGSPCTFAPPKDTLPSTVSSRRSSWIGGSRSRRPSTATGCESRRLSTPPSILVMSPSDISTRATPWEFGTPNFVPSPLGRRAQSSQGHAEHDADMTAE